MEFLLLAGGLALLLVCGDMLVRGAVALSVRLGVSALIIGLTVVAFGTSAPELVVSIHAAVSGSPGLAIGNVVGSNIANVLLVLGVPALIAAINCDQPFIRRNMIYVLAASVIFIALCFIGPLGKWHGALLLVLLFAFLFEAAYRANRRQNEATVLGEEAMETINAVTESPPGPYLIAILILAGLIGLPVGAHMVVLGATDIARDFGVSDAAIGLTLVAIGTSLPELATTIVAATRNHAGLALGNVLGSNLFNLLAVMGATAVIHDITVPAAVLQVDLWVMFAASAVLAFFVIPRAHITRASAVAFVAAYVAYLYFVFGPRVAEEVAGTGLPGVAG